MAGTLAGLYLLPRWLSMAGSRRIPASEASHHTTSMSQTPSLVTGGQVLTTSIGAADVFTREDLTDEQRMFGQAAAEFMRGEVLPHESRLWAHDWDFTRALLRKAASLDLLRLEIPEAYGGLGLDKISAAYVGEQIAV